MAQAFKLRRAALRDMWNVFRLSNDPYVRENSLHPELISKATHASWFLSAINSEDIMFYIAESCEGEFIGQVRFRFQDNAWITSISLVEKYRGQHMSCDILKGAMQKSKLGVFQAFIKLNNIASIRLFEKAGFRSVPSTQSQLLKMTAIC